MKQSYFSFDPSVDSSSLASMEGLGGKAQGLVEALHLQLPVPKIWVISSELFLSAQQYPMEEWPSFLQEELQKFLEVLPEGKYAVRSSAKGEDAKEQSYAGIFETKLDVPKQEIIHAIIAVWESAFTNRVQSYASRSLEMAVVLQPMIQAKYAGVAFSKNPSPSNVFENDNLIIEYFKGSGEQVVQGEVTPERLCGSFSQILETTDHRWVPELLNTLMTLSEHHRSDVDIEFAIDSEGNFWLLQQRPITRLYPSHFLPLHEYERKYKRALDCLDIEFLIEGCTQFLPQYLEIPFSIHRWMVMTTNQEQIQELWIHKLIDRAIVQGMLEKAQKDGDYWQRLLRKYRFYDQQMLQQDFSLFFAPQDTLANRFEAFYQWILPLQAHYYAPMFVIDALHRLLLETMKAVDSKNAEQDLFYLGTKGISTLNDLLKQELTQLLPNKQEETSFDQLSLDLQKKLEQLAGKYGFLFSRTPYEKGYSARDLLHYRLDFPDADALDLRNDSNLVEKYFHKKSDMQLLELFREWMRIRNQEMERLYWTYHQTIPLFEEIAKNLHCSPKALWQASSKFIRQALLKKEPLKQEFSQKNLTIIRTAHETRIHQDLLLERSSPTTEKGFFGKTVFGKGIKTLKVKVAYDIEDLKGYWPQEPTVLVTGMTTPDFIPFLKERFHALITDEGGILCHAAIIAREIPIPCIVGTSNASEHLKTVDRVEIHFSEGKITPLSAL